MIKADVRAGWVAAKRRDIGPPSDAPNNAACREPTASMTARTSSIRCSRVGTGPTRSESPVPRLSNMIKRQNDPRRRRKLAAPPRCTRRERRSLAPQPSRLGPRPRPDKRCERPRTLCTSSQIASSWHPTPGMSRERSESARSHCSAPVGHDYHWLTLRCQGRSPRDRGL
jgi:hypothetical protein